MSTICRLLEQCTVHEQRRWCVVPFVDFSKAFSTVSRPRTSQPMHGLPKKKTVAAIDHAQLMTVVAQPPLKQCVGCGIQTLRI